MEYRLYTTKTYTGKWNLSVVINGIYFTDINKLALKLRQLELISDEREFKKEIITLRSTTEEEMNRAKELLDSLLIWGKIVL